jgi:hypothetical protein
VIAAWVLACRARFADSSVKTARDGLSTVTLEAHSISTTRVTLQSFLPLSGRNGKALR